MTTHSFAKLPVSQSVFDEIRIKLQSAGYSDQFRTDGGTVALIDMHGIALVPEPFKIRTLDELDLTNIENAAKRKFTHPHDTQRLVAMIRDLQHQLAETV